MLTFGCIAAALGSGFLLGLPLLWLGRRGTPFTESDWLLAPFVGLAANILVLHNLVYAKLTVANCTPWIWASAAGLWLGLLLKYGLKPLLTYCPWRILLVMAAVYAFQGFGLLVVGAENYTGRAWSDQYNYTTVAQLLCDSPLTITWEMIGHRPYLVEALVYKDDRIGAMLLQGFLASSMGTDAKHLFEPTIILGPALVVLAIYSVACRLGLGRRRALVAAAVAGVLPAATVLHLDGFLAQVLAVPFLLYALAALHDVCTAPCPRTVFVAGVLLAATTALYTEFVPILMLLVLLFGVGAAVVRGLWPLKVGLALFFVAALVLGLNPLYTPTILRILRRLGHVTGESNPMGFGWVSGFGAVWFTDKETLLQSIWGKMALGIAVGLTASAFFGLLRQAWLAFADGWGAPDPGDPRRARALLAVAVTALALLPAAVLPSVDRRPYQFIKLLLTVGPLLVVGITALGQRTASQAASSDRPPLAAWRGVWFRCNAGAILIGVVALLALGGSASLVLKTMSFHQRTYTHPNMLEPARLEAMRVVEHLEAQPLVLACGPGLYDNCWFAYAARRNPVWLVSPVLNHQFVVGFASGRLQEHRPLAVASHIVDLKTVPGEALVLMRVSNDQVVVAGEHHLVWSNSQYQLWQLGPGPCALEPLPAAMRP